MMIKENLGQNIGKGEIPKDRWDWVIKKLGQSFRDPFHALRQYIDNARDAIILKLQYDSTAKDRWIIIQSDFSYFIIALLVLFLA